jgi:pre-mRNA-splicing factor SYF1
MHAALVCCCAASTYSTYNVFDNQSSAHLIGGVDLHHHQWRVQKFVMRSGIPVETATRVYRRYLKLEPTHVEEYIAYLKKQVACSINGLHAMDAAGAKRCMRALLTCYTDTAIEHCTQSGQRQSRRSIPCVHEQEQWGEAASRLAEVVNDEVFRSLEGKSKHALWLELADICTRHPLEVAHLNVEAILRAGIRKFTDEVGCVQCSHTPHDQLQMASGYATGGSQHAVKACSKC